MPNITNFSFTTTAPVFDPTSVLPGTAVNVKGGSRTDGTFFEGNGLVTSTSKLAMVVELFNLHTKAFQTVTVTVDDFMANAMQVNVLTIEDGTGTEGTGADPSDIIPPGEVKNVTHMLGGFGAIMLEWTNPMDSDFSHVQIWQDGILVEDNNVDGFTSLEGESETTTEIILKTVDLTGNVSQGFIYPVTVPDIVAPATVMGLGVDQITSTSARLSWINPNDADFSHVGIELGGIVVNDITGTEHTLEGLTPGTTYSGFVYSYDEAGNRNGRSVSFTTLAA